MQKWVFTFLSVISVLNSFAQPTFISKDDSLFKKTLRAIDNVIKESKYIIEGTPADIEFYPIASDFYYIGEENQSYFETPIRVTKILKGKGISVGDTIIGIYKQYTPGYGRQDPPSGSIVFRLWYHELSTSCFFLVDNHFPKEPKPNRWSKFKKVTYINSEIGYFEALYNLYYATLRHQIPVSVEGVLFNSQSDWYNYLKQYPDIKVPEKF